MEPNLIYLGLLFGLWLGVTAIYLPGTGIVEALSALALIGVVIVLTNMPTNWPAIVLIVVGVLSFVTMPFIKRQYAALAIVGLALQGLGGLFMFNEGLAVSPIIILLTVGVSLAYHQFGLLPILQRMDEQAADAEAAANLIGLRGRVVKATDPVGAVYVRGESWSATSDEPLPEGTEVVVVDHEGLQIHVAGLKQKRHENGFEEHI